MQGIAHSFEILQQQLQTKQLEMDDTARMFTNELKEQSDTISMLQTQLEHNITTEQHSQFTENNMLSQYLRESTSEIHRLREQTSLATSATSATRSTTTHTSRRNNRSTSSVKTTKNINLFKREELTIQ